MGIENPCVAVTCFLLLQSGNTSLHHASSNGRTELCELLLRAKADVEAKDKVLEAARAAIGTLVICIQNVVKDDTA